MIMKELTKISVIGLTKLNNAEYANFSTRVSSLLMAAGASELGNETADVTRYNELLGKLSDLVARTTASVETAQMQALEKQRDQVGQYIIDTVRKQRSLPIASMAEAAEALYFILKPYVGFYALPNLQETITINGMLSDLNKDPYPTHLQTLGLTPFVEQLGLINAQYNVLTEQRVTTRNASQTEDSKTLRVEMDALYDYMTTLAFAQSLIKPTDITANFVSTLNGIITETNMAYNQRIAQASGSSSSSADSDTGSDTSSDDTSEQYPME